MDTGSNSESADKWEAVASKHVRELVSKLAQRAEWFEAASGAAKGHSLDHLRRVVREAADYLDELAAHREDQVVFVKTSQGGYSKPFHEQTWCGHFPWEFQPRALLRFEAEREGYVPCYFCGSRRQAAA